MWGGGTGGGKREPINFKGAPQSQVIVLTTQQS